MSAKRVVFKALWGLAGQGFISYHAGSLLYPARASGEIGKAGMKDWAARALSALAVLLFAGVPLWLGIALWPQQGASEKARPEWPEASVEPGIGRLRIGEGPRLELADAVARIFWRTSAPADSLVTYGRLDAAEVVASKDGRLLLEHRFALPEDSFAPLGRIQVMSVAEDGKAVSAELGPGEGGQWDVFQEAHAPYDVFREAGLAGAFAWGDYNGDGQIELAVCREQEGAHVVKVLGPSPAVRRAGGREDLLRLEGSCEGLHWADFTADGKPDLLVAGDGLALYVNQGPPNWQLRQEALLAEAGATVRGSAVADMDADGLPDVVAMDARGNVVLYRNPGQFPGAFPSTRLWPPPGEGETGQPAVEAQPRQRLLIPADFTGDGRPDLCVAQSGPVLLVGGPEGYAALEGAFPPEASRFGSRAWAAAADWNGDGRLDLYVGGGAEGGELLRNDGVGRFEAATASAGDLADLKAVLLCGAWADLDGNGFPDLVLGLAAGGAKPYLNAGDGRFMDAAGLCPLPVAAEAVVDAVSTPDFNGDGAPDLQVSLLGGRALLLENRWWRPVSAEEQVYLKVRPRGHRGVCGSRAFLRDERTGRSVASAVAGMLGTDPVECCFGVLRLRAVRIEVLFSDGAVASTAWRTAPDTAAVVVVEHPAAAP